MWIDSHCHLDATPFDLDRAKVLLRAKQSGVLHMVLPGVCATQWAGMQDLAHQSKLPYGLGIHPLQVHLAQPDDLLALQDRLAQFYDDPLLIAVGEIGLDFFVPGLDREVQQGFFDRQLQLAQQFDLPVILHARGAGDALLKGLRKTPVCGGIVHAFNGSLQQALAFVALGFKLGFGGTLTFERALRIRHLAQHLPLTAIVLETDAPDIPPQWLYRTTEQRAQGQTARNEPGELPRIAQCLAQLRSMPIEELAQATTWNVRQVLPRLDKGFSQ